jgi:hypothetical protein
VARQWPTLICLDGERPRHQSRAIVHKSRAVKTLARGDRQVGRATVDTGREAVRERRNRDRRAFGARLHIDGSQGSTLVPALTYDSGAGNGPFGLGWRLGVPSITPRVKQRPIAATGQLISRARN